MPAGPKKKDTCKEHVKHAGSLNPQRNTHLQNNALTLSKAYLKRWKPKSATQRIPPERCTHTHFQKYSPNNSSRNQQHDTYFGGTDTLDKKHNSTK